MYSNILIPVNPDRLSLKAFKHAFTIAKSSNATVWIVNASPKVFDDDEEVMLRISLDKWHEDENRAITHVREQVMKLLNSPEMIEFVEGVKFEIIVIPAQSRDYKSILDFARTHGSDLIVLGLVRQSPAWQIIVGNFKEWIIHYAECPVLVIHD